MHILFLTQIVPYPPDAGPRVKTWHVLRYLAGLGHRITLVSFVRPEERQYLPALEEVCAAIHAVPMQRPRLAEVGYWLRSNLSGRPYLIERDDRAAMRRLVGRLVQGGTVDAIHADQFGMAQFALPYAGADGKTAGNESGGRHRPRVIFDAHNAVWAIVERMRQNAPWVLKPLAGLEARRVRRYEGAIVSRFDCTLAVTEPDRRALLEAAELAGADGGASAAGRIRVVPIAVDTQQLRPIRRQAGSPNILTLGTLHYPPNADGVRWFARQVFPLVRREVPQATLTIVGKNPPADLLALQEREPEAIRVTGYVPELEPYLERAALVAVAVRAGGGMRVRILEAFARGLPVVTTTIGLEGIQAEAGRDLLVADTAEAFAESTVRLLRDPQLQVRLSEAGRRLAETRYDWKVALAGMDGIYQPQAPQGG